MIDEQGVQKDSEEFFERLDAGKLSPSERNCLIAAHAYFTAVLALEIAPEPQKVICKTITEKLHIMARNATATMMMEQPHFPKPPERN